jgi:hypothetical protein
MTAIGAPYLNAQLAGIQAAMTRPAGELRAELANTRSMQRTAKAEYAAAMAGQDQVSPAAAKIARDAWTIGLQPSPDGKSLVPRPDVEAFINAAGSSTKDLQARERAYNAAIQDSFRPMQEFAAKHPILAQMLAFQLMGPMGPYLLMNSLPQQQQLMGAT